MSFKKAVEVAKKMQEHFSFEIPDGAGGKFVATCKVLTGEEAMWTYRVDRTNETPESFQLIQNFRIFCASLLSFKSVENGVEEISYPGDIIKQLYTPEELKNVGGLPLNFDEAGLTELVYTEYLDALFKVKSEEEFKKLPLKVREMTWELIYKGIYYIFDQDYIFTLTTAFLYTYRNLRPNPVEEQFMASIMDIVNKAKEARVERENEEDTQSKEENDSTGPETSTP